MLTALLLRPKLVAAVSGLALPLSFAPFSLWPLAFVIVAVMLWLWRSLAPREAFHCGFCFGSGVFLAGTYWLYLCIAIYGQAPAPLALLLMFGLVLIMAVYYGATAWVIARLAGAGQSGLTIWMVAPAAWVFFEWLRGWLLSGFPWVSLGYGQLDSPLAAFAPLGGVYFVSWLVVLVAVGLLQSLLARQRLAMLLVIAVFAGGLLLGRISFVDETSTKTLKVSLVQASVSQDKKWLPETYQPTLTFYQQRSLENLDADVVVWPEVAIPATEAQAAAFLNGLELPFMRANTALVLGILQFNPETREVANAMVTRGKASGSFKKHHLVPFGEYFPVPSFVREWMRLQSLPNQDMQAGAAEQAAINVAGHSVATSICYEDAFASEQQHFFPAARFIINITNDAWFGDSIAPHHHLDIARMRSIESGRWQLRAANTGVTAIIDGRGEVISRLPQFEPGVLRGEIRTADGLTPYLVLGNAPLIVLAILLLVFFELRRRRGV